jgi:hypothetical protein
MYNREFRAAQEQLDRILELKSDLGNYNCGTLYRTLDEKDSTLSFGKVIELAASRVFFFWLI